MKTSEFAQITQTTSSDCLREYLQNRNDFFTVSFFLLIFLFGLPGTALAQYTDLSGAPATVGLQGVTDINPSPHDPASPVVGMEGDDTLGNVHVEGGPAPFGVPAHLTVSPNNGTVSYSVPIDIPPGVSGLQPKISLDYNSASGNGQVGVGWSIGGLDAVTRCPQTIATNDFAGGVNDDGNDRFCLDGQQLLAVATQGSSTVGAYGANSTNYAKEIDDLSEIISYGGTTTSPAYFVVHTKSGLTMEYGNLANSPYSQALASNGSAVETWALDMVTDQRSNYMTISYINNGWVLYPNQINYTGNGTTGLAPMNSVCFSWTTTRPDAPTLYAAGSSHQTNFLLNAIATYDSSSCKSSNLVLDYALAYQNGVSTGRSDLISITKHDGSSPQNSLPPLTFTYSDAQIDTQPDLISSISNGFGASTNITYLPATSPIVDAISGGATYPQQEVSTSDSVVYEVQQNIPTTAFDPTNTVLGSINTSYTMEYFYVSPTVDLDGRGYLGFGASYSTDLQTMLQKAALYSTVFPTIGDPAWVSMQSAYTGAPYDFISYCYASPIATSACPASPAPLSAQGTAFPYVSQTVETRYDVSRGAAFNVPVIGTVPLPTLTNTYTYDTSGPGGTTWGNLTQNVDTTSDGYSKTTNNTYLAPNTSTWLTGLLSGTSVAATGIGQTTPQIRQISYTYNSYGEVKSEVIQPGGATNITSTSTYTYNPFGNVTNKIVSGSDVSSTSTSIAYNSTEQFPKKITNALNQVETLQYDARFGKLDSDTSINNLTTNYTYDTFGRLTNKTNPDGTYHSLTYTSCITSGCSPYVEQLEDQEVASDGQTQVAPTKWVNYDPVGRSVFIDTQAFNGADSRIADVYDGNGNLADKTNPFFVGSVAVFTQNTFDELGRVISTTNPDSSVDTTTYNAQTITAVNGLGQKAVLYKDGDENVSWTQDSLGNQIRFVYDGFDQLTNVTDANGNVTSYIFDILGRKIAGTDPDKGAWTDSYNSLGELVGTTDANGNSTTMTYDLLRRMTQRMEPDMTANWVYDTATNGVGELAGETASGAATPSGQAGLIGYSKIYTYDSLGRQNQVVFYGPSSGSAWVNADYQESFTYDMAGRPSQFSTNWDNIQTNYNGYGYEVGDKQNSTGAALWTATGRDAVGSLTSATFGNGPAITQNFAYDPNTERMTAVSATGSNSVALESVNYTYDYLGNVLNRITGPTVSEATPLSEYYSYDGLNRLCTVNPVSASLAIIATKTQKCQVQNANLTSVGMSMTYNAIGNITAKLGVGGVGTYSYPGTYTGSGAVTHPHAVKSISGISPNFVYDANGNMLAGNGRTITYTSFNMPGSITLGNNTVTYSYDAEHNRLTQVNPQTDTLYLADMEITAPNNGSTKLEIHTYFNDTNGQHVGELDRTGVTGSSTGTAAMKFYINDWQNSVSVITNSNGNVLEADSYDAWGKRRNLNGTPDTNDLLTSQSIHGYTNQEEVQDVQLIDLNARMYDPYLSTVLSVDPAVANWLDPQTWNAYSYARDNPMRYTDPTGECIEDGCVGEGIALGIAARVILKDGPEIIEAAKGLLEPESGALPRAAPTPETPQLASNVAQGKAGEAATEASLGDTLGGKRVTIVTSTGQRAVPDFVTKTGGVVETKTGGAQLTSGQKQLQQDIENGTPVTPVGKNAAAAGLQPNQPTKLPSFTVDRPNLNSLQPKNGGINPCNGLCDTPGGLAPGDSQLPPSPPNSDDGGIPKY